MATSAVSVNSNSRGSGLHKQASLLFKARNEVSRVERLLNMAKIDADRNANGPRARAAAFAEAYDKLATEHRKVCAIRDNVQREYNALPICVETLAGIKEFNDRATKVQKEGRDLSKILITRDTLDGIGGEYAAYLSERDTVHGREGLLNCRESFGALARDWVRTFEFEESARKILGQIL